MSDIRVTGQTERTTLDGGEFVLLDDATDGTSKITPDNLVKNTETIINLKADLNEVNTALETKAEIDGYYEEMTVGDAEQLVATQYVEDSVPYLYRTSGGSADIGNREYDSIVGGSVVWNQLLRTHTNYATTGTDTSGLTISVSNGYIDISGTPTSSCSIDAYALNDTEIPANHVCLILCDGANGFTWSRVGFSNNTTGVGAINKHTANWIGRARIKLTAGIAYNIHARFSSYDLTAMFGSTIADYINSLEQSNAGAGVAWFRKLFPEDYYEYNAGEMKHVGGVSAHEMVGFNQWDGTYLPDKYIITGTGAETNYHTQGVMACTNFIKVIPDTNYFMNGYVGLTGIYSVVYFDKDKNFVGNIGGNSTKALSFTTPTNASYIRCNVRQELLSTFCINLSWSGTRNGEYEPYVKHTYALDDSLTLRGIPKLDSSNNLYWDGDTYEADGTVTRTYKEYTSFARGSLDSTGKLYRIAILSEQTPTDAGVRGICNLYPMAYLYDARTNSDNGIKSVCCYGNGIYISGFVGEESSLDAVLPNLVVVNQITTPTTETATPYNEVQIVDDWGTEEYVSTSIVPVGHTTRYPQDLRSKLQHLPSLASADGTYAIQQSGTQMSLTYIPTAVSELPDAPTTDGTYTLKATVSNGTVTYTWES